MIQEWDLDLNREFDVNFRDESIKVEWIPNEKIMHLVFYFNDKKAEEMREKIGLKYTEEEVELHYGKNNIFPKCALENTVKFNPLIEEEYDFWIYSEGNDLRMFFEYSNISAQSFDKLMEQVKNEICTKVESIRYWSS